MKRKAVFKEYNMYQLMLPTNIDDLIPENHIVRVVNNVIERMDIESLLGKYPGGGCSSYHPRMMLKVIVYGYVQQVYSSRKIAKALRENINFMWLSGNNKPDFRTINNFRSDRMKEVVEEVFSKVLEYLLKAGYIKMENYFIDGTKIEGNANKHSYVWKKSTQKHKKNLQTKIKKLLIEIEEENKRENDTYGDKDLEELGEDIEIDSEELEEKVKEIEEKISQKNNKNKDVEKAIKEIKKDCLPRLKKYETQEEILGNRNSYSKTDKDATFMRMKDDHMKNGQLKAAYNVQIGTENQFILGYSIHQRPGDPGCFIPHMEKFKNQMGILPENVIGDSAYGSEENYNYMEKNNMGNYLKYNNFHRELKDSFKKEIFRVENFLYDSENDEFICPEQKRLIFKEEKNRKTENGYDTKRRVYECESCEGCKLKPLCTKATDNRQVQVSLKLNEFKENARNNLCSEKGLELRSKRPVEVETVFGRLKQNWSFRKFLLRGLEKVNIEFGLLSIAHNIAKMATGGMVPATI